VRSFEALLAQVTNDDGKQIVFSSVPAEAISQRDQLRGVLHKLGATAVTPVTILSDGAEGPRALDPFAALAVELIHSLPSPRARTAADIAKALAADSRHLSAYVEEIMPARPTGTAMVVFVDQLEELLTLAAEEHRRGFAELLAYAAGDPRLRVLATLRADFLSQCAVEPALAALIQTNVFLLGPPGPEAILDMVRRPADRAGLEMEEGLAGEILRDAGIDPGEALPLLAFCLEELHRRTAPKHRLTLDAYRAMDGLRGVIGRRAGELLKDVGEAQGADLEAALPPLFRALVRVDAAGKAARRRSRDRLKPGGYGRADNGRPGERDEVAGHGGAAWARRHRPVAGGQRGRHKHRRVLGRDGWADAGGQQRDACGIAGPSRSGTSRGILPSTTALLPLRVATSAQGCLRARVPMHDDERYPPSRSRHRRSLGSPAGARHDPPGLRRSHLAENKPTRSLGEAWRIPRLRTGFHPRGKLRSGLNHRRRQDRLTPHS
jgi:hypothetical protein